MQQTVIIKELLYYLGKTIDFFLPFHCILCSSLTNRQQEICEPCYRELPWIAQHCERCASPLTTNAFSCGHCLNRKLYYDCTHALFQYQKPISSLLLALKFKHTLSHARILGELLAESIQKRAKPTPDFLVPVPLHPKRIQERGFNQALELGRPVSKMLRIPILFEGIERINPTSAQSSLPAKNRKANVKRAFAVQRNFKGARIAVLDDIVTTGDTVNEFCRILKQNDASSIEIWCIARSILRFDDER